MFAALIRFYQYFKALLTLPPMSDDEMQAKVAALPAEVREKFLRRNVELEQKIAEAKRMKRIWEEEQNRKL